MKFQISTDGVHPFVHGHFVDENGPSFRGCGLEHLSENFFCRKDAAKFLFSKMSREEIEKLPPENIIAIFKLPVEVPPELALYEACTQTLSVIKMELALKELKAIRGVFGGA